MNRAIAGRIVAIPSVLSKTRRKTSSHDYLVEVLGPTFPDIPIDDLLVVLRSDPLKVESWLTWSDDKRTGSGWYLRELETGEFGVGYHPNQTGRELERYSDACIACANYIKREIESILHRG